MNLGMKDMIAAAETGNANAQFNLGVVYGNLLNDTGGHGSKDNRTEAIRWLLQAAQQGLPRAQHKLAEIYADESESSQSQLQACTWFLLAAMNLSGAQRERVQSAFDRVARQLAPEQVAEARDLARLWKATPNPSDVAEAVPA
jgi:TPR repeat protein